jgi:hypothetical protein
METIDAYSHNVLYVYTEGSESKPFTSNAGHETYTIIIEVKIIMIIIIEVIKYCRRNKHEVHCSMLPR